MAKPNLTDIYEALRVAEAEGRSEDVAKLISYIESVEAAPDIATEDTFDPREIISPMVPAAGGAIAGAVVPKVIESGIDTMQAGRGPQGALSKAPISVAGVPEGHTPYNPRGRSVEGSIQNWRSYNDAQLEAAKKVRQESAMHKKYPGFTRAGTNPVLAPLPKNAAPAERIAAKMLPGGASDIANFAKGVYDYKLPFVGSMGSLLGRGLAGAGAGMQGTDAYNRYKMGDTTGAVISGLGSLGTASTLAPHPAAKVLGSGVGLTAEAINAYRDAMRRGQIEHGAPEDYERVDAMGNAYAHGGLVHLAAGGDLPPWKRSVIPNPEDEQGMFSYAPGFYAEVADNIAPEGKTAGPNDAARHMLAAADLTRRISGVPLVGKHIAAPLVKGLGYGHELANYIQNIGGGKPQTKEDMEQDLHNNALGISLGQNAGSFQDIVNRVPAALNVRPYRKELGKAYIRNPQEAGTPYKPFGAFASGGLAYLAEGGKPPKPDANEGGAFIGYPQINKNRKVGSGTGFLDALVGAPPSRENILNPSDYSYMEGYEKGEPYGIAGMVLPFTGIAKNAVQRAMPLKTLDLTKHQFLHGTSPEAKAAILESGKFDPHPARWPSYSYSEIGADTTYATPKQGWWLDKEKAASGRATQYENAVGVDIDPSAKIAHIRNVKDWEKLAKKAGFKDGADMYRSLSAENLDSYNYAKNLTPQQYDQLQMERIQKNRWLDNEFGYKPGDFHYKEPEVLEEWIKGIPAGREQALNDQSILGPRAAVQKIRDKGYHGIYVDKHGNEDWKVSIPADEQLAIFDQSVIKPNPAEGYAGGGRVGALTALLNLVRNRGGSAAATHLERATDDAIAKYHPLVQKGLAEGRIHPNDAQWMSDYAHTPGRAEVETGGDGWKDQSEKMRNFVGRMERGEVPTPQHFQGQGGVNIGGNSSGLNPPPIIEK